MKNRLIDALLICGIVVLVIAGEIDAHLRRRAC